MSAGSFTRSKYETDDGQIHPIRVQPETLTAGANTAPAGETTSDISAKVSLTRRATGLRPRYITVKFLGAAPDDYKKDSLLRIPILTKAYFDSLNINATVTYLENDATIISKEGERIR